ncbi:MAG TPA: hypothetical protein VKC60_14065 [Opitutaceae bacterium]|nr:hypothetical protein [Opitutaceae bacterium]
MNEEQKKKIILSVLSQGLDDWICFLQLDLVLRDLLNDQDRESRLRLALDIIKIMVKRGWIDVGTVDFSGFVSRNLPLDQMVDRIKTEAHNIPERPFLSGGHYLPGDVCWLNNTLDGDSLAKQKSQDGLVV